VAGTRARPGDSRARGEPLLLAAVAPAATVVLGIELLSQAHALRPLPMLALAVAAGAAGVVAHGRFAGPAGPAARPRAATLVVAAIGLVTLATALVAAPNTWDSMTYHLPRVAHWAANASVAHYPTSIDRQLWQPPFGEYLVLVPWVLVGGHDRLANLPAWLAAAGAVVAGVEIARLLGLPARGRALAALAVATLPPLVLEATSTQTDLPAAFWLGVVAYLALAVHVAPATSWRTFAWIGAALGLAVGTKGTSLPLGLPWVAVALWPDARAGRVRAVAVGAAVMTVAVLGLNAGHWSRNLLVFNGPLGPASVQALLRPASLDPATVAGNLVANATVHLGTPSAAVNDALAGAVRAMHAWAGVDVAGAYPFFGGYRVDPWSTHENVAGAPVHAVLAVVGLALAAVTWRRRSGLERTYVLGLLAGVVLLGATVRWQPYNARLHLPLFVVGAAGVAATLGRVGARPAAAALVVACVPALVGNATRPVWAWPPLVMPGVRSVFATPRAEQYFASRRDLLPAFAGVAATIPRLGCRDVRLKAGYDGWEYPLWRLLDAGRLDHAFVQNASTEIGERPLAAGACLVVVDERPDWRPPPGTPELALAWANTSIALFVYGR
jgi:hypothetical protein